MRLHVLAIPAFALWLCPSLSSAVEIRGQYLEARSCDVYTGPCFANGELGSSGKEAVMAWKVDEGSWNGIPLAGLSVALVLKADASLGDDGVFPMRAREIDSVILMDDKATPPQAEALIEFVKDSAAKYTKNVLRVEQTDMFLQNNYITAEAVFQAGDVAEIRTRQLGKNDCICTNEMVYFQPLTDVHYATPAYSLTQSFAGEGLNSKWTIRGTRSSFLAVFKK